LTLIVLNLATVWRAENQADDFLNLMALFRSSLLPLSSTIWLPFDCFVIREALNNRNFAAPAS
jgi:hypothetical protein